MCFLILWLVARHVAFPVFGWAFHIFEFIPVERRWETDEANLRQIVSSFKDPRDGLWLGLFPEGTDYTEAKCERSKKFAAENGLPLLNNVLLPRTKGFASCLQELSCSLDAVYDVTIGYKTRCPSFLDNVYGIEPSEVHIHIRRINLINCLAVTIFTIICTHLTFFSSMIWFKIYISLACAYLTTATYFNIRPVPLVETARKAFKLVNI